MRRPVDLVRRLELAADEAEPNEAWRDLLLEAKGALEMIKAEHRELYGRGSSAVRTVATE